MKSTVGRPRRATDEQVRLILKWHTEYLAWQAMRPAVPSHTALARALGLPRTTVVRIIAEAGQYKQGSPEHHAAERTRRRLRLKRIG